MEVIDATGIYKPFKILGFSTSKKELIDLTKAWVVISLVFAILFGSIGFTYEFLSLLLFLV